MFEQREKPPKTGSDTPFVDKELEKESPDDECKRRHGVLMDCLQDESERQREERIQMQIDEDYYDHLQWRPDDAQELIGRGQAPLVFNEARQSIDWVAGTEKRMRKDYKILPREQGDEAGAELKTKLVKYTDDVNLTHWHRSKAFKQASLAGLSWLEEGINPNPEKEMIYSGSEDWRNVFRDSRSRNLDFNEDARYLFRRKVTDLDYAIALLPKKKDHLQAIAGRFDQDEGEFSDDIWYLGEKLTGASETEWFDQSSRFGNRQAFVGRNGYYDYGRRQSVELLECWYRVPESVKVFSNGPLTGRIVNELDVMHMRAVQERVPMHEAVKMRMRVMIATKDACLWDGASPFRHGKFLLVPVWGYRRARDGMAYGVMRGMRDIQDDLNKRRSKALFALSVNRVVMDKGAVDDIEDTRQEAARPDGIIIKNPNKELKFEKLAGDFQGNLELAQQDAQIMRNVAGVTNENLGRDTNAQSGRAILAKQDQGTLSTSELFDHLMLSIKIAGQIRLSHIEQFWTEEKAIRIVGDSKPIEWVKINSTDPITGERLNDITQREADFVVDTQDYRASMAQAAMEQIFDLLGKVATFAPQAVISVLDLVVESADVKHKDEWVARIRKLNGQRDPSKPITPEEQEADQKAQQDAQVEKEIVVKTALAKIAEMEAKVSKMDVESTLKRVETMYSALQAAQIVASVPNVAPAADEIAKSGGLQDMNPGAIPQPEAIAPVEPGLPAEPPSSLQGVQQGIETPISADNFPQPAQPI